MPNTLDVFGLQSEAFKSATTFTVNISHRANRGPQIDSGLCKGSVPHRRLFHEDTDIESEVRKRPTFEINVRKRPIPGHPFRYGRDCTRGLRSDQTESEERRPAGQFFDFQK